jgi:3'-phosphoadenosine 5'-phosphosulfate sulfotransferase (PAPS reductase)/FAD synthetase
MEINPKFSVQTYQLQQRQSLPLTLKVMLTINRIQQWYEYYNGDVVVSFSGGKDSTVLLDLVRKRYPEVKAVFVDTGLEYPEIKDFVKTFENVDIIRPKHSYKQILEKYGYPVIHKRLSESIEKYRKAKSERHKQLLLNGIDQNGNKSPMTKIPKKWLYLLYAPYKISDKCCHYLKKEPLKRYQKQTGLYPIIGTMASDSNTRQLEYQKFGCNAFDKGKSMPLSFWKEQDILQYIENNNITVCEVYGKIIDGKFNKCQRTGCMFCAFGAHKEKEPNRYQRLAITHPKIYNYIITKLDYGRILTHLKIPY